MKFEGYVIHNKETGKLVGEGLKENGHWKVWSALSHAKRAISVQKILGESNDRLKRYEILRFSGDVLEVIPYEA